MAIISYSLKKDGEKKLSENFKVKEFKCKDGSDTVKIDTNLVEVLQELRNKLGKAITITSGYRTEEYNKKVGGATNSYHKKGQAADIYMKAVSPLEIAKAAEEINVKGIGQYNGFTHVDTRTNKYFWKNASGNRVTTFVSKKMLHMGDKGEDVKQLQRKLKSKNCNAGKIDGIFGEKTFTAVKQFQRNNKLIVDGIVGEKTLKKLEEQ